MLVQEPENRASARELCNLFNIQDSAIEGQIVILQRNNLKMM